MRSAAARLRSVARIGIAFAALSTLTLSACGIDNHERDGTLTKQDYKDLMDRVPPVAKRPEPPIPDLQPILAAPAAPTAETRLVTVSVTESTPLKDLLIELARKAEMDVELDAQISGGIIMTAKDRPFLEVIERVCDLGNLRYTLTNNVLRVEVDRPFHKNYRVEKINQSRKAESEIGTNTNVFSAVSGGSGSSGEGNASSSKVESKSEMDFWKELDDNLKQIMGNSAQAAGLAAPSPLTAAAAPAAVQPAASAAAGGAGSAGAVASAANAANATTAAVNAATGAAQAAATGGSASGAGSQTTGTYFSINKQAGLISVFATGKQHKKVQEYLNQVKAAASAQVLIEAKIVEVSLSDGFKSGINWGSLGRGLFEVVAPLGGTLGTLPSRTGSYTGNNLTGTTDFATLAVNSDGFTGLINFVKNFGTVRTLSSPRLTVINNETAILKVASNEVYFKVDVTQTPATIAGGQPTITYNSQINTVPIGVIMTVQPVVNLETSEVSLGLRPTLSRIVRQVQDPAVMLQNANVSSTIPVVEVREMDSVVTIPSGDIVVMGGLMQERAQNDSTGIPGFEDIPVAGNLFKARSETSTMTELVIFLRATVVNGTDTVHRADKELYQKFTKDPRPLGF